MQSLSERDRQMLDFTNLWWQYRGNQEAAIRERFDVTVTRFWQEILRIIENPAALAYDPLAVKRLQRARLRRSWSARRA